MMTATEQALTKLHDLLAPIPALGTVLQDMDESELAALPVNIQASLAHIAIAETKLWMMFTAELRRGPDGLGNCTCPAAVREAMANENGFKYPGSHHSMACPMHP